MTLNIIVNHLFPFTFYTEIPTSFQELEYCKLLVQHESKMKQEDLLKLLYYFVALCKRVLYDLFELLRLEETYRNMVAEYLKVKYVSMDTTELQELMKSLKEEKHEEENSAKKTKKFLETVKTHVLSLFSISSLADRYQGDKEIKKKFTDLTLAEIREFATDVSIETRGKTMIMRRKYMCLSEAAACLTGRSMEEVHVVAEHCLRVDTNLTLPGTNLFIMSPHIQVIQVPAHPVTWDVSTLISIPFPF